MRFYGLVAAALTCIAFVQPVRAADKDDQAKKPKNYAEAAEDCEKAIERRKHELANQYSTDVWMLKDKFQKAGDLEKALVADKEWSRSLTRKPLTQEHLVESFPELANLQREYITLFTKVAEAVATEFLQDLKKESSDLAKAGKLADGRVLQQEIDTIKRLHLTGRDGNFPAGGRVENRTEGDVIAACEEAIRQKRVATQAQYVGELEAMEKSFQAKGALEDLFAAKAERNRFLKTPILAEENLVETPDALRDLQQKYWELQRKVTSSVAEEFITRLEQRKQALTIEGELDEALKAKNDAEQIRRRYGSAAADSTSKLRNSIKMEFKLIPAGKFTMGDAGGGSDETPHQVTLTRPFYLGVHEVTNAQWRRVMGDVPSKWRDDDRPVEQVNWADVQEFCRKLSAMPDERKLGRIYRLPTEAEWEYACRAGTSSRYSFGDDDSQLGEYAWCNKNSNGQTHPVGKKKPNPWGLHDMHGNVWEWCNDFHGAYGHGALTDPQGPPTGFARTRRGGSWCHHATCRSADRSTLWLNPTDRWDSVGFRVAISPPSSR